MSAEAEMAFVIALLVLVYFVVGALLAGARARRYRRQLHTERTRGVWAEAREELFNLVRDQKLDPRSATFRTLYGIQTFIVRRPDAYEEIAHQLQDALMSVPSPKEHAWFRERSMWPPELMDVLRKMAAGTEMLAFGYPGLTGKLLRATWDILPEFASDLVRRFLRRLFERGKHSPTIRVKRELLDARARLQTLAGQRQSAPIRLTTP